MMLTPSLLMDVIRPKKWNRAFADRSRPPAGAVLVLVAAATIGAVGGWLVFGTIRFDFQPPPEVRALYERVSGLTPSEQALFDGAVLNIARKTNAIVFGCFGLAVGALLGAGIEIARGDGRRTIAGFVLTPALGFVFGGLGGVAAAQVTFELRGSTPLDATLIAMASQSTAWMVTALGIALAMAVVTQQRRNFIRTGAIAGAAGLLVGLLYPFLGALLFPMDYNDGTVPDGIWNRLVWAECAAVCIALGTAHLLPVQKTKAG